MSPTVYLVSGANRGIGLGITKFLAARDNVVVYAGTRNPSAPSELDALVNAYPSKVHIVKLTSADQEDNQAAVETIKKESGKLDVVIANAGIAKWFGKIIDAPAEEMMDHFKVNVLGPLTLFQSAWPLLSHSETPRFFIISAKAGSISQAPQLDVDNMPYGVSKAAVIYLSRKLHFEHPSLLSLAICPGSVLTEAVQAFIATHEKAKSWKMEPVEKCVSRLFKVFDNATRESAGGKFFHVDGSLIEW